MKITVIGATGHVGTFLVPMLIEAGHEVTAVSRGNRSPYREHAVWDEVRMLTLDRAAEERDGSFGSRIAAKRPDAVIDLICFSPERRYQSRTSGWRPSITCTRRMLPGFSSRRWRIGVRASASHSPLVFPGRCPGGGDAAYGSRLPNTLR